MPPALFSIGSLDPFLDDSILMHAYWRLAGNSAYLAIYKGCPHGFDVLTPQEAKHHQELSSAFISACLDGES